MWSKLNCLTSPGVLSRCTRQLLQPSARAPQLLLPASPPHLLLPAPPSPAACIEGRAAREHSLILTSCSCKCNAKQCTVQNALWLDMVHRAWTIRCIPLHCSSVSRLSDHQPDCLVLLSKLLRILDVEVSRYQQSSLPLLLILLIITISTLLTLLSTRVWPVPDPAEKPQPFSAVGLLLTRTS